MPTHKDISAPAKVALRELESGKKLTKPRDRLEMLELSRRLISKKSKNIVDQVLSIALDTEHPHQMEALKLLMSRIAPVEFYNKMAEKTAGKGGVNIQINVVNPDTREAAPPVEVVEIVEVPK